MQLLCPPSTVTSPGRTPPLMDAPSVAQKKAALCMPTVREEMQIKTLATVLSTRELVPPWVRDSNVNLGAQASGLWPIGPQSREGGQYHKKTGTTPGRGASVTKQPPGGGQPLHPNRHVPTLPGTGNTLLHLKHQRFRTHFKMCSLYAGCSKWATSPLYSPEFGTMQHLASTGANMLQHDIFTGTVCCFVDVLSSTCSVAPVYPLFTFTPGQ
eukprot:gene9023-biopygen1638